LLTKYAWPCMPVVFVIVEVVVVFVFVYASSCLHCRLGEVN